MKPRLLLIAVLLLVPFTAGATDYYVDNTNPNARDTNAGTSASLPWLTLGKAASTLVPGDTVTVQAGSYDERVTPLNSGTTGKAIRYIAGTAAKPKVRGFTVAGKNYIEISGFEVTSMGFSGDRGEGIRVTDAKEVELLNNSIHHTSAAAISFGNSSFIRIRGNQISHAGISQQPLGGAPAFTGMYNQPCSDILIEENTVSYVSDYLNPYGARFVFRNNILGPSDPTTRLHVDGVQPNGVTTDSLVEGNLSVENVGSDNHLFLNQVAGSNGWIIRYNVTFRSKGGLDWRNAGNHYLYNNTFYNTVDYFPSAFQVLLNRSTGNVARNNIWYHAVSPRGNPYLVSADSSLDKDYDLWFNGGNPEERHGVNADPRFVDAAAGDFHLRAGSRAIGTGGPLTTVHVTDTGSGTSLIVGDAHLFQPGWAGVSPDWIAVGDAKNTAQIASIDYSTNTITLVSPIARSSGQPVWLYKNSSGKQVLFGSAPDIGAFEFEQVD